MSTIASLETLLTANTSQHDSAISKSEQTLGHLSTTGEHSGSVLQQAFHKAGEGAGEAGLKINSLIPGFSALGLGIAGAVGFLTEATKAAMEGQVAQDLLTQSLNNNVKGWQSQSSALNEAIEANMKLGFSDEQLKNSIATLVTRTHDVTKAIDLQSTAMDFARGRHIDLATATGILGKVYDGNIGILNRYGVAVEKGATATEALAKVQQTFSGAADTYGKSAAGSVDRLKVAFDEALQKIGTAFLPIIVSLTDVLSALIPPIVSIATVLLTILKPAFDVIIFMLNGVATVLGWVGGLFTSFSDTVTESSNTASSGFQQLPQGVADGASATTDTLTGLQSTFSDSASSISDSGYDAGSGYGSNVVGGMNEYIPDISQSSTDIYNTMDMQDDTSALGGSMGSLYSGGINTGIGENAGAVSASAAGLVNSMDQRAAAASLGYQIGNAYYANLQSAMTGGPQVAPGTGAVAAANNAAIQGIINRTWQGQTPPPSAIPLPTPTSGGGSNTPPPGMSTSEQAAWWKAHNTPQNGYNPDEGMFQVPSLPGGTYASPSNVYMASDGSFWPTQAQADERSQIAGGNYVSPTAPAPVVHTPHSSKSGGGGGSGGSGGAGGSGTKTKTVDAVKEAEDQTKALSDAVDAGMSAISKLGDFKLPTNFDDGVEAFAGAVDHVMMRIQQVALKFKDDALAHISLFSDSAKSGMELVSSGVDALTKLKDFAAPAAGSIDTFVNAVQYVTNKLGDVAKTWSAESLALLGEFSDSTGKAMDMVSKAVDSLGKLKDFKAPAAGSIDEFANSVQYVTNKLGDVASKWSANSLTLLGEFSDSTGKAMDMVSKSVDSLGKLKDFKKPADDSMNAFVDATDYLTDRLRRIEAKWDASSLDLAAKFGTDTGTLMDGVGKAVDNLSKLVDFVRPADYSIESFFGAFDQVVQKVSDRSRQWYGLINKDVSELAGYVGSAVNGMLGSVDGISKLGKPDLTLPTLEGVDKFFDSLDLVLPKISERARTWYGLVNQGVSETAGYIGSAVTGLLGAVDGMTKLASPDTKVPSGAQIDAFFDSLDLMAPKISDRTRQWYGLFNKSSADLAGYVGTAATGLLSAIDPMSKIVDFKKPTQAQIDDVFDSLDMFLTEFDKSAASFQDKAGPVAADVATRVGTVAAGIGAAFDPLTKVADVQNVTKDQIQGAMANVWELLNQTQIVMAGMPADFPAKAASFGSSVNTIFSAVKSGFDIASSVGGDTGGSIGAGFAEALTQAENLVNYLNVDGTSAISSFGTATDNLRIQVVDDWGDMAAAADAYIKLLGQVPQTPVPPGQTPPSQTPPPYVPPVNPPIGEDAMRVPPLGSQATGAGGTVMYSPIFLDGAIIEVTEDEHAALVTLARRDRRKKGGMSV